MHGSIIYNVKGYPSRVPFHPDRVYPEFSNNPHLEISDSPNLVSLLDVLGSTGRLVH